MGFIRNVDSFNLGITLAAIVLVSGTAGVAFGDLAPGGCIDFESLTSGTVYPVPTSFSDSGVTIYTQQFQYAGGAWTSTGYAEVTTNNQAGGLGNDINVNNVTLDFDFGRDIEDLRLLYGNYGGNVNITINGVFRNEPTLDILHGQVVGGVLVEVVSTPTFLGVLRLTGVISSFSIGGQELWIDDVCDSSTSADCVEFEDAPYPHSYSYGQFYVESDVVMEFGEFFYYPTGSTTTGSCNVGTAGTSGGTGQDVNLANINIDFDFDAVYGQVDLLYHNGGGNINVRVNGVLANVENMTDLHMTTVGGGWIEVQPPAGNTGQLIITGPIDQFSVGGQELWIDHVCISDRVLFADGFESGNTTAWSLTFP